MLSIGVSILQQSHISKKNVSPRIRLQCLSSIIELHRLCSQQCHERNLLNKNS